MPSLSRGIPVLFRLQYRFHHQTEVLIGRSDVVQVIKDDQAERCYPDRLPV